MQMRVGRDGQAMSLSFAAAAPVPRLPPLADPRKTHKPRYFGPNLLGTIHHLRFSASAP
jgi:hypothetical protein